MREWKKHPSSAIEIKPFLSAVWRGCCGQSSSALSCYWQWFPFDVFPAFSALLVVSAVLLRAVLSLVYILTLCRSQINDWNLFYINKSCLCDRIGDNWEQAHAMIIRMKMLISSERAHLHYVSFHGHSRANTSESRVVFLFMRLWSVRVARVVAGALWRETQPQLVVSELPRGTCGACWGKWKCLG